MFRYETVFGDPPNLRRLISHGWSKEYSHVSLLGTITVISVRVGILSTFGKIGKIFRSKTTFIKRMCDQNLLLLNANTCADTKNLYYIITFIWVFTVFYFEFYFEVNFFTKSKAFSQWRLHMAIIWWLDYFSLKVYVAWICNSNSEANYHFVNTISATTVVRLCL